jgi:alcohol dehydrogenase (cytochrome c)
MLRIESPQNGARSGVEAGYCSGVLRAPTALCGLLLAAGLASSAQVTFDDIAKSPNKDWLTYNGDYAGQRHSPLTQINPSNAGLLAAKWVYHFEGARRLETVPLVYGGVMYVTNTNEVHALDARTGRRIWRYKSESLSNSRVNRGAAIYGDKVFLVTYDAHLVAIHRTTGGVIWDRPFANAKTGYFSTMAPLVIRGAVLVGVGGGGSGQRGFVAAMSPDDGRELWRFWTVPARGEPGSETWGNFPADWGGGPTWTTGTYDAALDTVYWPTGNPWPDFFGGARPGDNLYTDSVVALDGRTGKLKWYFQFVPHDVWDWDANETPVLIDASWKGQPRKLLVQSNRNGFHYVLDRVTGEFLHGQPFVKRLDWASGLDGKGRPILAKNKIPTPGGTRICPSVRGATNWMSPTYNPATGLFYVVTLEQCDIYIASAKDPVPNTGFRGTGSEGIPTEPGEFFLRALDATTGEIKWQHPMPGPGLMWAGTLSTAGGVVFTGDDDGNLVALDAKTGKDLWNFGTGHTLYASPMTYEVDGRQYVTISAETNIFTFGLFEPAVR